MNDARQGVGFIGRREHLSLKNSACPHYPCRCVLRTVHTPRYACTVLQYRRSNANGLLAPHLNPPAGDETGVLSTRTRAVVAAIQEQLQPTPRTKRSRGSDGAEGPAATTLPLSRLTAGKSRHGAATTFYEMLVLHNRGLARLRQDSPYGDIVVAPRLEEMAAAAAAV